MDTIKLKRATKSVANASTKVLEKDEVLVVTPDSGSGKGKCQLKFGDGITAAKSLPIAIDGENADEMKVSTIPTDSDENPVLSAGETVKVFFGKIKKKFTYLENLVGNVKSVTNLFGNTDAKTVAQGLQILVNTKLSKTDKYDGVDSTSTELWATANAVRKVNEKTDNNSTSIRELNSNLEKLDSNLELLYSSDSLAIATQDIMLPHDFSTYKIIIIYLAINYNGSILHFSDFVIRLPTDTKITSNFTLSSYFNNTGFLSIRCSLFNNLLQIKEISAGTSWSGQKMALYVYGK